MYTLVSLYLFIIQLDLQRFWHEISVFKGNILDPLVNKICHRASSIKQTNLFT